MCESWSDPLRNSNGAEAWRLIHSRDSPDTQNRQYTLMQKIMMPSKLWCEHTEGFESGLRSWELHVGERERASGTVLADAVEYTVMMNMAAIFLRSGLQLGYTCQQHSSSCRCYSSRNFGANPTASSGNGTSADDDRMQVDSLKKGKRRGKGKKPTPERKSHDQHELYRHQHVHELWKTCTLGEKLLESRWRSV